MGVRNYELASRGARLVANILDELIPSLIIPMIGILANLLTLTVFNGEGFSINFVFSLFIGRVVIQLYFWNKSTTLGKSMLHMVVVDKGTGDRISTLRIMFRDIIGKWISGLIFGLGYFWILIDKDKQGWHDKLAGTVVVYK